jgi:protein TonB
MPLRCLLFSSNEEIVQPIWQVLTDLGIEGEYCRSAVDAVEKVTTQLFQIVITDWDDQPEATFLLKTARDQKAAQRPLTLAIVSDDARLPEALQAGANSVLMKPIRSEQVRDTMTTACELLRAKQPPPRPAETAAQPEVKETAAMAAAANAGSSPISAPKSTVAAASQESEKTFRAGEFLQSSGPAPGAQFITDCDIQKSMDQVTASEVDALTELEPMAASVENAPPQPASPRKALDSWASLQARLTRPAAATLPEPPSPEPSAPGELLGFGETPSFGLQAAPATGDGPAPPKDSPRETDSEAALFSYMEGESPEPAVTARSWRSKAIIAGALAVACTVLVAIPRTRRSLVMIYRNTTHAGRNWLNSPPVQVPPTVTQHETFEQDSNEYKLPVASNIPDATTDPAQIRVLPVVDPTAKPTKNSDAGTSQTVEQVAPPDQSQSATESGQAQPLESQPTAPAPGDVALASPGGITTAVQPQVNPPVQQEAPPQQQPPPVAPPVQNSAPPHPVSAGNESAIPSSLRSQLASTTPEASGNKPMEAAMSSIEPVNLPEAVAMSLLAEPVDAVYPDTAKASAQRGSVVLQVLIGRDGAVQDAKFLQGSLVFARAAIDAVRQWRFKPYTMNGRAVSVQSLITLNFKPPA